MDSSAEPTVDDRVAVWVFEMAFSVAKDKRERGEYEDGIAHCDAILADERCPVMVRIATLVCLAEAVLNYQQERFHGKFLPAYDEAERLYYRVAGEQELEEFSPLWSLRLGLDHLEDSVEWFEGRYEQGEEA